MGNFGDVRAVLQGAPSEETWAKLVDELDQWYGREPLEMVLEYCSDHVSSWPAELPTFAPVGWYKRDLEVVRASPITAFFEDAVIGRTSYWLDWGAELLASKKALKIPKFMQGARLGEMKWRTGVALGDAQRRQLVVLMREFKQPGVAQLERMRQLLDDEDCQRWSSAIYDAWTLAGEASSHRWSLFQVAAFGHEHQLDFDARVMSVMVSSGRHARVKQYMDVNAAIGTPTCIDVIGQFAVYADLRLTTRNHAIKLLEPMAASRSLDLEAFIARRLDIHDRIVWEPEVWEDPSLGGDETGRSLASALEHAMIIERAFPWWRIRDHADLLAKQPAVVWRVGQGRHVRFSPDGAVDAYGASVELEDADLPRVAHPVRMAHETLDAWKTSLDALGIQAPFMQLDRPVFRRDGPVVWDESDPIAIDIDDLGKTPWRFGIDSGDYGYRLVYWPKGAMWHATLDFESRDGEYYEEFADANGHMYFRSTWVYGVLDAYETRDEDEVAFSEAQWALLQLLEHQKIETELEIGPLTPKTS